MKRKLIFFLLSMICSSILFAVDNNDEFIVKDIFFRGLNRISEKELLFNMCIQVGHSINNEDIAENIRTLYATKSFEYIEMIRSNKSLIIKVKESPIISKVYFSGNYSIKNSNIRKILTKFGIQENKIFHQSMLEDFTKNLNKIYRNVGKYNVIIKYNVIPVSSNNVRLEIKFTEGVSATIKQINIEGLYNYNKDQILSVLNFCNKKFFKNKVIGCVFEEENFFKKLKDVHNFYVNQGFINFKIVSAVFNINDNTKDEAVISIRIHEGEKYTVSDVVYEGNSDFYRNYMNRFVLYPITTLYNESKIKNSVQKIKYFLSTKGYIFPSINIEKILNDANKTVKIIIKVDIGTRFYVNKIEFIGNTVTKEHILRREMHQLEKKYINVNEIYKGKFNLERLGFFETIDISIQPIYTEINKVNIIYKVKERATNSVNASISIGKKHKINFQSVGEEENLLGTGRYLNIKSTYYDNQKYIELYMEDPYNDNYHCGIQSKLFYNNLDIDEASGLYNYHICSYGTGNSVGLILNKYNHINFSLDYIHNYLSNMTPQISTIRYLRSLKKRIHQFNVDDYETAIKSKSLNFNLDDVLFGLELKHNSLNHNYFPQYGSKFSVYGKITLPESDNQYYKTNCDVNSYIPLNSIKSKNLWIFMSHAYIGYASGLYKQHVPFFDNFYTGGYNTVRSFRTNTIGPKAVYFESKKNNSSSSQNNNKLVFNSKDSIGGNAISICNAELIIPSSLLNTKCTKKLRLSLFVDTGTVWDTFWKNTDITRLSHIPDYHRCDNVRVSSGILLQWNSYIGPLILSYAKPIKKFNGDKLEIVQLNFGKIW